MVNHEPDNDDIHYVVRNGQFLLLGVLAGMLSERYKLYRRTGIDILGDVPWGTHLCLFYETEQDLIDILVPYFKAGLESNEFCMWITSEPLNEEKARSALRGAIPDFDRYLRIGQMEIISHNPWYLKDGVFNLQEVMKGWIGKIDLVTSAGFSGVRVTGNTSWLETNEWRRFADYERQVDSTIDEFPMLAICSYASNKCSASEIVDVVSNHGSAMIRRNGKWDLVESFGRGQAVEALRENEEKFRLAMLDYQQRLRDLTSEMSMAEERERRRIAVGLHDQVAQELIYLKISLGSLVRKELPIELAGLLDEICQHVDQLIQHIRTLTFDLSSPTLYELGLEAAVREYLHDEVQQGCGIHTEFEDDAQPKPLTDDVRAFLYRAIRELLINVVKHARAQKVKVVIARDNDNVRVEVTDDGIGFAPFPHLSQSGGFGLFSIRERLDYLGGRMEVEARPGQGTHITFTVPVMREAIEDDIRGGRHEHKNFGCG